MKTFIAIVVLMLPLCAQSKTTGKVTPAKAAAKPAATPQAAAKASPVESGLPAEAVAVDENLWKYTDKAGKIWFYRLTPFGYSRWEERKPATVAEVKKDTTPETQVSEQGDSVKFVRPGPFGNYTWIRKKSEMEDSERVIYENWLKKADGASTQSSKTPAATKKEE